MTLRIKGVTTIKGLMQVGLGPIVAQNFLTNQATPSWLDNSGTTGNRMVYDSTGKLTWAPNNQLVQSQSFNNASWTATNVTPTDNATAAPDGTNTAANIVVGAATGATVIAQASVVLLTSSYIISIYIKKNVTTRYFQLRYVSTGASSDYANFDLDTGTVTAGTYAAASMTSVGNGWYRISMLSTNVTAFTSGPSLTFIPASNSARGASYTGNSTDAVYIWGAQLERVTYQTQPSVYKPTTSAAYYGLRFDYDPAALAAKGLLIEESRQNIILQSTFASGWTAGGASAASTTDTPSPDGTNNAAKLSNTGTSPTSPTNYQNFTSTNAAWSHTVYAKAGTVGFLTIGTYDGTTVKLSGVNLTTGAADIAASGHTITTQNVGNGWWRVTVTYTYPAVTGRLYIGFYKNSGSTSYTPTVIGADYIYVFGAQVEAGAFVTSYIPTTSAAVTRVADIVKLSGAALTAAGAAIGSAVMQTTALLDATAGTVRLLLGSSLSRRLIYLNSNTAASSYDGSAISSATIGGAGSWTGSAVRTALGWGPASASIVANNGTLATGATALGSAATVYLGSINGTSNIDGWIASMAIYNQRLPDATLQAKSVVDGPL